MIQTQYIEINMVPSGVMPVLSMSQYDIGRPLGVVVYNDSEVVDLDYYAVTVEATRTDGTAITANVTTNGSAGVFTTTATMTNKKDTYGAQLVLVQNGKRVASLPFLMRVVAAEMDENAESIEEDKTLYQQYTGTVQGLIATINADLADEIAARQSADSTLQDNIDDETSARLLADSTLQGNIDAEASARQSADSVLQGNINSEASARTVGDASLQSQINQIVAPLGEAPSAAEVENARIGADGTTYSTLGAAIRTQVSGITGKSPFNESIYGATAIPANSDLDNYTTVGNYYVATAEDAETVDNVPVQLGGRLTVMHTNAEANLMQIYTASDDQMFVRATSSGGWGEWVKITDDKTVNKDTLVLNINRVTAIPANSDLNNYTTVGNYAVPSVAVAQTIAHIPEQYGGRLTVSGIHAPGSGIQIYTSSVGNTFFRRLVSAGTWSNWVKMTDDNTVNSDTLVLPVSRTTDIPANANMNNYNTPGNYKVASASIAQTIAHIPESYGGRLIVAVINAAGNGIQIYISSVGNTFYRLLVGVGTWSDWVRIATMTDIANVKPITTSVYNTTDIPQYSDLDDYTTVGNYRVSTLAIAQTIDNIPTKVGGRLTVMHSNAAANTEQIYLTSNNLIYVRSGNPNGWKPWVQLITSAQMQEATTLGTALNECAKTYYEYSQFGYFTYGNRNALDYTEGATLDELNCSCLAALLVGGCPFYLSRYIDQSKPNRFYTAGYGFNFYQYARQLVEDGDATEIAYLGEHANDMPDTMIQYGFYRFTWLQAQALDRWGLTFDILDGNGDIDVTKLQVGDIIYYGTSTPDPSAPDPSERMLNGYYINHCNVVTRKDANGTTYAHDAGAMPMSIVDVSRMLTVYGFEYAIAARVPLQY